jgi:hypothetical protein
MVPWQRRSNVLFVAAICSAKLNDETMGKLTNPKVNYEDGELDECYGQFVHHHKCDD